MNNSDDSDDKGRGVRGTKRATEATARRSAINPQPRDEKLCWWLESEWHRHEGVSGPSRITLGTARGPHKDRMGRVVRDIPFGPGAKPDKERLIEITNELVGAAQSDCDAVGRATVYQIVIFDPARDSDTVGRHLMRMEPSLLTGADDDEDEGSGGTVKDELLRELYHDRRFQQVHNARMFESYQNAVEGIIGRYEARLQASEAANATLLQTHMELIRVREEMLDRRQARELKADREKFFQEKIQRGINMIESVVVPIAQAKIASMVQAAGGAAAVGELSALQQWVQALTDEENIALFGAWNGEQCVEPGILTVEQAQQFVAVAKGASSDIEAFQSSLTVEQIARVQSAIATPKLAALMSIVNGMKTKAATSGAAS